MWLKIGKQIMLPEDSPTNDQPHGAILPLRREAVNTEEDTAHGSSV